MVETNGFEKDRPFVASGLRIRLRYLTRQAGDDDDLDDFTYQRITRLIDAHKKTFGRDISEAEVAAAGVGNQELDALVRQGIIDKYQVTTGKGTVENRFKLHRDWRSLRLT